MKAKLLILFLSFAGLCFGQAALPFSGPISFGNGSGGGGGGGGGTPGGSNGDYQYNNAGAFGGYSLAQITSNIFAQTITTVNATTLNVNALLPASNDGAALGSTSKQFSDLFLAEGGVINWDNGDATITQTGDVVLVAGAALANSSPGTAANSVATIDATQTLTAKTFQLTAAHGTDDTLEGMTISGLLAGATIAQWEAVYIGGSSTYLLADANGTNTYPARGLAVAAYSSTNPAIIITRGTVRNDAWNWTPGGTIYLSGTPGALTQSVPAVSGDKVQAVGYALTADIAFFDFDSTYVTVQ